jgi:signal transduction histidine kinase
MAQLIEGLLNLSRIARTEVTRGPVNLSELAEEIVAELREGAAQREVSVVIQPNLTAEGDRALLRVALENLLGNAWKFTGKQSDARIEFGAATVADERVFFVRDNGAGFDAAYLGKLFKVFQRLHSASEFEGTGIGLATVQRIIRRHDGRVWCEGEVGKGATFYFILPA